MKVPFFALASWDELARAFHQQIHDPALVGTLLSLVHIFLDSQPQTSEEEEEEVDEATFVLAVQKAIRAPSLQDGCRELRRRFRVVEVHRED